MKAKVGVVILATVVLVATFAGLGADPALAADSPYCTSGCSAASGSLFNFVSGTAVSRDDWMKYVSDNVPLNMLSIPGTHDSATFGIPSSSITHDISTTQSWNIGDQLNNGIRAFDIRAVHTNTGEWGIWHCTDQTGVSLDAMIQAFKTFLNSHPTETVFLRVESNAGIASCLGHQDQFFNACNNGAYRTVPGVGGAPGFGAAVSTCTNAGDFVSTYWNDFSNGLFYTPPPTTSQFDPTLGQIRKKIVILDDEYFFSHGDKTNPVDTANNSIIYKETSTTGTPPLFSFLNYNNVAKCQTISNATTCPKTATEFEAQDNYDVGTSDAARASKLEAAVAQYKTANQNGAYAAGNYHNGGTPAQLSEPIALNWLNGGSFSLPPSFPIWVATYIDQQMYNYMTNPSTRLQFAGIVMMDFPGRPLIDTVIRHNYNDLMLQPIYRKGAYLGGLTASSGPVTLPTIPPGGLQLGGVKVTTPGTAGHPTSSTAGPATSSRTTPKRGSNNLAAKTAGSKGSSGSLWWLALIAAVVIGAGAVVVIWRRGRVSAT